MGPFRPETQVLLDLGVKVSCRAGGLEQDKVLVTVLTTQLKGADIMRQTNA
jgi:hypothetical protein